MHAKPRTHPAARHPGNEALDATSGGAAPGHKLDEQLDRRLTRALEAAPAVHIPSGFAAEVAAAAAARFGPLPEPAPHAAPGFGPLFLRAALVVLLVAMLVLACFASAAPALTLLLGSTMCAEFIGLSIYISLRRQSLL